MRRTCAGSNATGGPDDLEVWVKRGWCIASYGSSSGAQSRAAPHGLGLHHCNDFSEQEPANHSNPRQALGPVIARLRTELIELSRQATCISLNRSIERS